MGLEEELAHAGLHAYGHFAAPQVNAAITSGLLATGAAISTAAAPLVVAATPVVVAAAPFVLVAGLAVAVGAAIGEAIDEHEENKRKGN
jgi:hypothetical protein